MADEKKPVPSPFAQAFGLAGLAAETARNMAKQALGSTVVGVQEAVGRASQGTRDTALALAQRYLRHSTLTLPLPEALLNQQIRARLKDNPHIDYIQVDCLPDRFDIKLDGHFQRMVYTLTLSVAVKECQLTSDTPFMRFQQLDQALDVQWRQAPVLVNWATRHLGQSAFQLASKLPLPSLTQQIVSHIPGLHREGIKHWRLNLAEADMIDFLNNRSWLMEKLVSLGDRNILPGLNLLQESQDWLQQLVSQIEVKDLSVQSGRLDMKVGLRGS